MELLHSVLKYIHLIGFAFLTIGALAQWRSASKYVSAPMLYGALVQLFSGFGLVGVLGSLDQDLNPTKISIKLGLVIVIVILLLLFRKKELSQILYYVITALIMLASVVAVFV